MQIDFGSLIIGILVGQVSVIVGFAMSKSRRTSGAVDGARRPHSVSPRPPTSAPTSAPPPPPPHH